MMQGSTPGQAADFSVFRTTSTPNEIVHAVETDGYVILEHLVPVDLVQALVQSIESLDPVDDSQAVRRRRNATFAIRNAISVLPHASLLASASPLQTIIEHVLGPNARIVRSILFDKNPEANWTVPWHQDTTIAVKQRIETEGFGPWSVKAGVCHVRPPTEVLEKMLTARVHLDDCDAANGALKVVPGSHRHGLLDDAAESRCRASTPPVICEARLAGVLLMRPLLLHASSPAESPRHRRVLHLEFASEPLPNGLQWHDG
jgi:ectoine hydroxylase-related dioxygenase (phytanoyl-CoA dioxygenase family)